MVQTMPTSNWKSRGPGKIGEPRRQSQLSERFGHDVARVLWHRAERDVQYYARCKRALIVSEWINGVPVTDIETAYTVNGFAAVRHGDIRGYVDGSRFLLESVLRIAAIVLGRAHDPEEISALLKRLDLGVPPGAFFLTELPLALTRGEILALWNAGMSTKEAIQAAEKVALEELLGSRGRVLYDAIHETLRATGWLGQPYLILTKQNEDI